MVDAGQVDQVNHLIRGSRQRTAYARVAHFVREIETEQNGTDSWPELAIFRSLLRKIPTLTASSWTRPESDQVLDDSAVDLTHPTRVAREKSVDGDARDADVCLIGRREFPVTVRAHPAGHAPIVSQLPPLLIGASAVVEFPLVAGAL